MNRTDKIIKTAERMSKVEHTINQINNDMLKFNISERNICKGLVKKSIQSYYRIF